MERTRALARVCQPHQRRRRPHVDRARTRGVGGRQPRRPPTHRRRQAQRRAKGSQRLGTIRVFVNRIRCSRRDRVRARRRGRDDDGRFFSDEDTRCQASQEGERRGGGDEAVVRGVRVASRQGQGRRDKAVRARGQIQIQIVAKRFAETNDAVADRQRPEEQRQGLVTRRVHPGPPRPHRGPRQGAGV